MAELPLYPDTDGDANAGTDHGSTRTGSSGTSASRWVYMFWIIGIGLILLFVVLHLTGIVGPHGH